jgi:hypothetical protein
LSEEINAYANPKIFAITINEALMIFYHKMLKVFASTLIAGDTQIQNTMPTNKIVNVCQQLMQAYLENRLLKQKGLAIEDLDHNQSEVVSRLVRSCECFAVAHELGHIVIVQTKGNIAEYSIAKNAVEEFLNDFPDLPTEYKGKLIKPWTNEVCADLLGLQLSLSQPQTEPYNDWGYYEQWLSSGAQINRLLGLMLQEYEDRLTQGHKIAFCITHPHDYLRVDVLRKRSEQLNSSSDSDLGSMFGLFTTRLLDGIFIKTERGNYKLRHPN